jgi:hypothetical protein
MSKQTHQKLERLWAHARSHDVRIQTPTICTTATTCDRTIVNIRVKH